MRTSPRRLAADPGDNGGGVLGEMLSEDEGLPGMEKLADVSCQFAAWVLNADELDITQRLEIAARAIEDEMPSWWDDFEECIGTSGTPAGPDAGPSTLEDTTDDIDLYRLANGVAQAVVDSVAAITVTERILGGMTSGFALFVWAAEPEPARVALADAIQNATRTIAGVLDAVMTQDP